MPRRPSVADAIEAQKLKVCGLELQVAEARLPVPAEQITEAYGKRQVVEEKLKEITAAFSALDNAWRQLLYEKQQVVIQVRELKRRRDEKVQDVQRPRGLVVRSGWQI